MSSILEVILRGKNELSPVLRAATADVASLQKSFSSYDLSKSFVGQIEGVRWETITNSLDKIDRAGRNASVGLSAAGNAARLLGIDISSITAPAAMAVDAVGDIAGAVATLGLAGAGIGVLVVAFGALNAVMEQHNRTIAEDILKNDEWVKSIERAAQGSSKATAMLQEFAKAQAQAQTGWSWDIGDIVDRWERFDTVGRGAAQALHMLGIEARDLAPFLETSAQKAARLKDELNNLVFAAGAAGPALKRLEAVASVDYEHKGRGGTGTDSPENIPRYVLAQQRADALRLAAEKAAAAWNRLRDAIRNVVSQALTPTTVTQADIDATKNGTYQDKWDELARQAEAVDTGSSIDQFLALNDALKETGMSAGAFATAFRDMSLFADPANLKFADLNPIFADVSHQIDMVIGRANLLDAAFDAVWNSMSSQKKIDLANALGIDVGAGADMDALKSDIEGKITDPAGAATKEVDGLGSAIKGIPTAVLTTFSVKKDDLFDSTLKEILEAIAKIPTSIEVEVTMKNGIPTGETTTTTGTTGGGPDGRAAGGPVVGGKTYWVGEEGPELFIPHTSGTILPNMQSSRVSNSSFSSWTGGNLTINIHGAHGGGDWMEQIERQLRRRWGSNAAMRSAMRI